MVLSFNVAEDFSRYPAGQYLTDGPNSGERFRKTVLIPAIQNKVRLLLELDGVRGYGSSFLEEAFGGLIRDGYSLSTINQVLILKSEDPSLIHEIQEYINAH